MVKATSMGGGGVIPVVTYIAIGPIFSPGSVSDFFIPLFQILERR